MADFSGLLGVLAGGLSGYSTGAGLDLAAKLREQAAMDELAVQKYGQLFRTSGSRESLPRRTGNNNSSSKSNTRLTLPTS
jgi:hypothetical protein